MKSYTIGEIFRLGLLKNYKGEPYTNKGTVSRIVNSLPYEVVKTAWGEGKVLTAKQIKKYNKERIIP